MKFNEIFQVVLGIVYLLNWIGSFVFSVFMVGYFIRQIILGGGLVINLIMILMMAFLCLLSYFMLGGPDTTYEIRRALRRWKEDRTQIDAKR